MKVGTVVINPFALRQIEGKQIPSYATIYLSPHKTIDRNLTIKQWCSDVRNWKAVGFIDIKAILSNKLDEILKGEE